MRFPIQLNTDQSRRLQETFSVIYPDANSFGDGLRAIEKRYSLLETANLTYFQNLAGILQTAAAEGWLMPLVDFTLRKVQDPDLEALRKDLLPRARAVGVDPFLVCRLSGSNIMLDRRDLRSYLRSLSNPYGKRLLVVKGSRKTGKTHTCQLISYLQQCVGGFAFRRIDLELFTRMGGLAVQSASTTAPIQIVTAKPHGFTSGNSVYIDGVTGLHGANGLWIITVTEASEFLLNGSQGKGVYVGGGIAKLQTPVEAWQIAEVLTDMLPYEVELPDAPTDAQWARWVNKFCNKLEKAIVALPPREQQLWIVIDSFHSVLLAQSSVDLIREMANRINLTLPHLRMILLGFEDSLPVDVVNHLAEETIGTVTEDELIDFIQQALMQMEMASDTEKIADIAEAVLKEANPADPEFLFKVGPAASREFERLEAAAEAREFGRLREDG